LSAMPARSRTASPRSSKRSRSAGRPPLLRPERDQRGDKARARGRPGILIGRHPLARALRSLDAGNDRGRLAMNVDAERLDVRDVDGKPAPRARSSALPRSPAMSPHRVARFIADVAVIDAVPSPPPRGQARPLPASSQSFAARRRGPVEKPSAPWHMAAATSCLIRSSSVRTGRTVVRADHRLPHRAETDIGAIIDPHRLCRRTGRAPRRHPPDHIRHCR
jgi:hypothetical protein